MKYLNKYLLCLISGALLTLSFAPFNQFYLGIICPLILLLCLQHASPKQAFWRGLIFGIGLFATGISWVYVSIHTYGNADIPLSLLITALLVLIMALFPALMVFSLAKWSKLSRLNGMLCAFPAAWVLFEWMRSWIFTGFPWLLLGYSQISSPLAGFAPILSVFGVSLAAVWTSAALLAAWQSPKRARLFIIIALILVWGLGQGLRSVHWTKPDGSAVKVSMVQGNISQSIKWSQAYQDQILQTYQSLNKQAWGSSLIFWPEAAVPLLPEQVYGYLNSLNQAAKSNHAAILLGLPLDNATTQQYYNGAIVIGNGQGLYLKRHLVPFGEYVPLLNILGPLLNSLTIPMSSFSEGPDAQALPIMNGISVAVFICYESAFPEEFRDTLQNAQLIATLSDDSWFGHSLGLYQHQEMDQMRALETGRYLVRSTNNGGTSVVNPQGKIIASLPAFTAAVLNAQIIPMTGRTPWLIIGIWPLLGLILAMLMLSVIVERMQTASACRQPNIT
ncbi:MAG: apolipoprotein N-acyltransferase [Gammaproteobacteria bacterium]|nr:apolipoprotein N-acyltransferase [Gammaproteobacteria bacterium]